MVKEENEKNLIFIEKAEKVHDDKYDYSLVDYKNNRTPVKIICSEHGIFEQTPDKHTNRKHGCPSCGGTKKITKDEYFKLCNEKYDNLFSYNNKDEYKNAHSLLNINCSKHGLFQEKAYIHVKRNTCSGCKKDKVLQMYIDDSNVIHEYKYDYSLVEYKTCYDKVKIICPIHGIFEQGLHSHKQGFGCRKCNSSKGEKRISNFLNDKYIKYTSEKTFRGLVNNKGNLLKFDFYLPEHNTCIEYDGEQHFKVVEHWEGEKGLEERKINDKIKDEYCKNNNIHLIRIPYYDFDKIESILSNYILTSWFL